MVAHLLKKQDKKQCQLENPIPKQEQHLELDIIAPIQVLKQWQGIGLVKSGNIYNKIKNGRFRFKKIFS